MKLSREALSEKRRELQGFLTLDKVYLNAISSSKPLTARPSMSFFLIIFATPTLLSSIDY